jgi:hypothetical protein
MRTRTRAASYGASSSSQAAHAGAAHPARPRIALGEEDGALRVGGDRAQERRVELGGDLRELVGGGARRRHIACGEHDLDVCRKHPGAGHAVARLVHHAWRIAASAAR